MQQLTCESLNGVRATHSILATGLCTLYRDASPLEHAVPGS